MPDKLIETLLNKYGGSIHPDSIPTVQKGDSLIDNALRGLTNGESPTLYEWVNEEVDVNLPYMLTISTINTMIRSEMLSHDEMITNISSLVARLIQSSIWYATEKDRSFTLDDILGKK